MACDQARIVSYLSGELNGDMLDSFEQHLLGCDEFWTAVRDDRGGRELAERLRDVAPPALRDVVRARVELASKRKSEQTASRLLRRGVVAAVIAVAVATSAVVYLRGPTEPAVVNEVLRLASSAASVPSRAVSTLEGTPVSLARYELDGTRVVLARSAVPFPMPEHGVALGRGPGEPWLARRGAMSLLCFSRPEHVMVAGRLPPSKLLSFARGLGLNP